MSRDLSQRIVCVEWDDAGFNSGYYDEDNKDIHRSIIVKTVGHLIKRDRSVIITAADNFTYASQASDQRHITTIPSKMIRRVTYLTEVK